MKKLSPNFESQFTFGMWTVYHNF